MDWNSFQCSAGRCCRRRSTYANRDAKQKGHGGRFRGDGEECIDFGGGAFEDVWAPKVERHGRELKGEPDHDHERGEDEHHERAAAFAGGDECGNIHGREASGDRRQVGRARKAGEQADAVEHDTGGTRPINGVLQRSFARAAATLEDAGHYVGRHARHFDGEEYGHQMIGRRHEAHAERCTEEQRVKILPVLAVGEAGQANEDDERRKQTP